MFSKTQFAINVRDRTITCPANKTQSFVLGAAALRSKRRRDALKDFDRLDGARSMSVGEAC
jgi:hypothetical protein